MRKINPILNEKYGDYIVISEKTGNSSDGHTTFNVRCKCGKEEFKCSRNLRKGRSKMCKSCASKLTAITYPPPIGMKKPKDKLTVYYKAIISGAKRRDLEFKLSKEFIYELLVNQNFKCNLSGLLISLDNSTASLDRIDSLKSYTKDNVQWLHKDINRLKNNYNQSEFINMCSLIVEHKFRTK